MTIRRKLLLFIPLLVLLVNSVTFFLFQSGKVVQRSYGIVMDRVLLYEQSAHAAEDSLKALYGYLINPSDSGLTEVARRQQDLRQTRDTITHSAEAAPQPATASAYGNMLETLSEQEERALDAAKKGAQSEALVHYGEAEKTSEFIRDEERRLVDLELGFYQPVYEQVVSENERMNKLGIAVFIVNTLTSIVVAVWISRSITVPVSQLVARAGRISGGDLNPEPEPLHTRDELGILSGAFERMLSDLKVLIEKDKEHLEKDRLVKELELQALQSQINPHFLFNSLNVLSRLALIEGAEKTSDLIVSMSNLLRYNLSRLDKPVTLGDELAHVKEYFTIQQARFRDRVRFETAVDDEALGELVPALTIQPLVENAFVHGIEGMEKDAVIRVEIRKEPCEVRLTVSDNGAGMTGDVRQALLRVDDNRPGSAAVVGGGGDDAVQGGAATAGGGGIVGEGAAADSGLACRAGFPASAASAAPGPAKKASTGLGTRNVFKRLQLFYGRNDLVDIDSAPGRGTTITIRIPAEGKES